MTSPPRCWAAATSTGPSPTPTERRSPIAAVRVVCGIHDSHDSHDEMDARITELLTQLAP
ncbi:hypothetical protein [Streptomyces erythrochromogenes]|uniref:hypothetical protein n=1 Tax=Streptomyces erythrochromogenes TaxID=285574 RepID=UPI003815E5A1|nr:hypothetical protein OG489_34490 [Streptomyces erythrochromogenes]